MHIHIIINTSLQFLSLKAGDERSQLIPVLTTMLKLSPDEKLYLTKMAAGNVKFCFKKLIKDSQVLFEGACYRNSNNRLF